MSLLSYNELVKLVEKGVINADPENINAASIDITLHNEVLVEVPTGADEPLIDLKNKQTIGTYTVQLPNDIYYPLDPGQFILASSVETFNLPNDIACEYKLKSSLARSGLQHMLAGWCDPGWTNSRLTLELKNVTQHHVLALRPGMKIGQMVFFRCEPVPKKQSYAVKGQYNNQEKVTNNKGLR